EADEGATLRIVATSTDSTGVGTQTISAATGAVVDIAPTLTTPVISGTPEVGDILTATAAVANDSDATVTYQRQRAGSNIMGADALSYRVSSADLGHTLTLVATSTDPDGSGTSKTATAPTVTAFVAPTLPNVAIGILPAGKEVTVNFEATVDPQFNQ